MVVARRQHLVGLAILAAACGGEDGESSLDAGADVVVDVAPDAADAAVDVPVDAETGADAVEPDAQVDSGPSDAVPPRLRDVRASITGPVSTDVDLNGGDVEVILPVTSVAEFTIFASDDVSASDALIVDFIDADGEAVTNVETSFRNGLWNAVVDVGPGTALRARVSDEAGNQVLADAMLIVPTISEAIVGDWATRRFAEDQSQVSVRHHQWSDGEWAEDEGEYSASGTWAFDGEFIAIETAETTADAAPPLRSDVYVDEFYFDIGPLRLTDGSESGIIGTWASTAWIGDPEVEVVTELLLGADDRFTWTEGETSSGGSWRTEVNEDYSEAFGNFLVLDVESRDGAELGEVEVEVMLYRRRGDALLLAPQLRISEQ